MHKTGRRWPLTLMTKDILLRKLSNHLQHHTCMINLQDQHLTFTTILIQQPPNLNMAPHAQSDVTETLFFLWGEGKRRVFFAFSIITFRLPIEPYWLLGPLGINLYFILRFRGRLINQFNYLKWFNNFI